MKKKTIAALLIGTVVTSFLSGCGQELGINKTAECSPSATYVEAEYPESRDEPVTGAEETCEDAGSAIPCPEDIEYNECKSETFEYEAYDEYDTCLTEQNAAGVTYSSADSKCAGTFDSYEETYCPGYICPVKERENGENYKSVKENGFTEVSSSPLSTFGASVDTASYSNFRRMVNDGFTLSAIPSGSIRTEELINYFDYDYKEPKNGDPFAVNASIIDCPWNKETKLVNLGIKAKEIEDTDNVPSNIVFLIDVSGSMESYDKLPLLQMGLDMLIDDLDENDRVSIVTYASSSDIVIAGVPGDRHSTIKKAVNSLEAQGSTNGGEGIKSAYKLARKYFIKGGNNRVIMATDGDLNVGVTSEEELEELITKKKESGVFLSVLGFGTDNYNEVTLETLASKGNGNYSYIDSLLQAKKVLVDEFNSTLFTVAKDVKFQTEFNPKYVSEYRLVGYEKRQMAARDFNDDTKDGGEVGSGHAITVMYEIKMNDEENDGDSPLRYQNTDLSDTGRTSDEWMTVSVRYKEPDEDESKLIYFPINKGCYTKCPDCDTLFAACVAECGMILNNSDHIDLKMKDVVRQVSKLDTDDEYKEEFLDLIKQL